MEIVEYYGFLEEYSQKEYQRRGKCVRFLVVDKDTYAEGEFDEGVQTFTLDVSFWSFTEKMLGRKRRGNYKAQLEQIQQVPMVSSSKWFKLTLGLNRSKRDGYFYPSFGNEGPVYFELKGCEVLSDGPSLNPIVSGHTINSDLDLSNTSNLNAHWRFYSYHVGQGMCSLITNESHGILLDCGVGTPILRPNYLKNLCVGKALRDRIKPLKSLEMVLSHADTDHWRVLNWDSGLLSKINTIYVPEQARSLALKDQSVIHKIKGVSDFCYRLGNKTSLQVFRSKPSLSDANSECLVSVFESEGRKALIPGDYVYEHFPFDSNQNIQNLKKPSSSFDVVIVPHHGDKASSRRVVDPASKKAVAFFSAGNHSGYRHPTASSLNAHVKAGFTIEHRQGYSEIEELLLIS